MLSDQVPKVGEMAADDARQRLRSSRQRFDDGRRQPRRDRGRDAQTSLARKLELNCRRGRALRAIPYRGDQHLGEAATDSDLSAPAIDLARTNIGPPRNLRDYRSRRQALGNNRPLLLGAPPPPPFRAGNDFQPRHCTVSSTRANTVTCTGAYQPDPPPLRKVAFTGRVP